MADQENNNRNQTKGPDFVAYNVRENSNGKDYWDRVGVGFKHKDGKGVDIRLNSLPTDGHVTLRQRAQDFKDSQEQKSQNRDFNRTRSPNPE